MELVSSSTSSPSSPRPPHSIEPSHDEVNRGSQSEITRGRPKERLRLSADRPRSASPSHGSVTHQASKLQVNTDITQGSTNYVHLDVTKELEDEGFDVFAEGNDEDDDDTGSTKGRKLSAISDKNPAFDSNISELQDDQPDYTQSPRLGLAEVALHRSDLKNNYLPKQRRRRGATRNVCRKRPRTTAPIGLASAASTVSAALESTDLEEAQSRALITAPDQEREIRDIDQEIDDGSTDDSNDGDYAEKSDAAGSKIGGRPRSRKRVRWTKDTEDNDVEAPSTHSLDVSCQAAAATSSGSMHESEEIPIHGYFTLKTIESKVAYCLTFSQELLPRPQDRGQRQDTTTDLEEPQSVALVADPNHQWGIRKIIGQKRLAVRGTIGWNGRTRGCPNLNWPEPRSWWMRSWRMTGAGAEVGSGP